MMLLLSGGSAERPRRLPPRIPRRETETNLPAVDMDARRPKPRPYGPTALGNQEGASTEVETPALACGWLR